MANPHRGQVDVSTDGATYRFSLSVNAICELEDKLDRPIAQIADLLNDPAKIRMKLVRTLTWAALLDHQPEISERDAGTVVSAIGIQRAVGAVMRSMQLAFPDEAGGEEAQNPPKAAAG